MIYTINTNLLPTNNKLIQPIKINNNRVAFSDSGFPLWKNKVPETSSAFNGSSLFQGSLYLINLQRSSLL